MGERRSLIRKMNYSLQRIIEYTTKEGDIVLDFHLGSGTTAAVAHKMDRQYIGIEQMDYAETLPVERLNKVIAGDQGGISESVNWQGGWRFHLLRTDAIQPSLYGQNPSRTILRRACCTLARDRRKLVPELVCQRSNATRSSRRFHRH